MKIESRMNLKDRLALVTGGLVLLAALVNTLVHMLSAGGRFQETPGLLLWLLLAGLVSVLVAAAVIRRIADKSIVEPLAGMSHAARMMAAGDLSRGMPLQDQEELADLGRNVNTLSANFRETLGRLRAAEEGLAAAATLLAGATAGLGHGAKTQQEAADHAAQVVGEMASSIKGADGNARDLSRSAAEASSSAYEMAASIEEVARNAGGLAAAVEDAASSVEQMIASIKQVSENTDALSASAEQTSSSVTEMSASVTEVEQRAVESARLAEKVSREASERGMDAAVRAIRGMENVKNVVEAGAAAVNRLGKRSQEIGRILKVIDEVTDQTGLLALNAAILAAQAGDHGKGFAVVAEEIKDLAERTAASTREISTLIASVQDETAESVEAMGRGLKAVDAGVALVIVTSEVLEQVADSSRQAAETARAIEKTTAEQARGVAQISETSAGVAEQVDRIANALKEQRLGSERIVKATERMREITRQVKTATQEQTTGGVRIADAVEAVTAQATGVAAAASQQYAGVQRVSDAVGRIRKIARDAVDAARETDKATELLKTKAEALKSELAGLKF